MKNNPNGEYQICRYSTADFEAPTLYLNESNEWVEDRSKALYLDEDPADEILARLEKELELKEDEEINICLWFN